jgi:oligosaccharide repeat unit polymerase
MNAPAIHARPLRLSWPMPAAAVLAVAGVLLPLICWFGLANPDLVPEIFNPARTNTGILIEAVATVLVLFFLPLTWMLISRRGDFAGIWLMQNGLLAVGFFFLPQTAFELGTPNLGPEILRAGGLVATINALGFLILLVALGLTFLFLGLARAGVKPLPAPPESYDRRLLILLRLAAVFCIGVIALSMAAAHTIPMLASDPVEARYVFDDNAVTRPFYNANMAILPFVCGGLLVMFLRTPRRLLGLDGALAVLVMIAQLLSGNRFPLAVAVMVSITLLTMEKKWPRPWLLLAVLGYFVLFIGLSGFTSIWRQNRDALSAKEGIVAASFREAYAGNNLIDYRDAAWVFSQWDHQPLMGKTYLGGIAEMLPSGLFPMKRQWHLGQTALRIVGWGDYQHFGLRLSGFGESFLNFGLAGVVGLALILGIVLGTLLRYLHLLCKGNPAACLSRNLRVVILMQMLLVWTNSSDAFMFWALLALLAAFKVLVFRRGGLKSLPIERRTT